MDIKIIRSSSTVDGTPGTLDTGEGFTCDTLELQWANNQSGISCILPDTYSASIWYSPTLDKNVVRLEDKHGRSNCLIHNGNWAGEGKGEVTQIHGCTEVGYGYGKLVNTNGIPQFAILSSVKALDALTEHIQSKVGTSPFTVTYSWTDIYQPTDMMDLNPNS